MVGHEDGGRIAPARSAPRRGGPRWDKDSAIARRVRDTTGSDDAVEVVDLVAVVGGVELHAVAEPCGAPFLGLRTFRALHVHVVVGGVKGARGVLAVRAVAVAPEDLAPEEFHVLAVDADHGAHADIAMMGLDVGTLGCAGSRRLVNVDVVLDELVRAELAECCRFHADLPL